MTDKEALREFSKGASFVILVMAVMGLILAIAGTWGEKESIEKFTVVDKYKECDVVRYTDRSNSWHYFLYCK